MADINIFPVVPYRDFYRLKIGAYLGDASVTIDPNVDKCSVYIMPVNTMTTNRTVTVNNTGGTQTQVVQILRLDRTANILTINNSTPTLMFTSAASPTADVLYQLYFTGGIWTANSIYFAQST